MSNTNEKEVLSNRLTVLAMMGEVVKENYAKKGIDLHAVIDENMKKAREESPDDPVRSFQKAMFDTEVFMLKTMPLENRCIFMLNTMNKLVTDGKLVNDADVDWVKVNTVLFKDQIPYDYNICESVNTIDELSHLLHEIQMVEIIGGPWYKQTCKTCGTTFYLDKSEILFYMKKELHIPKRCKNCIMESKGQESYRQRAAREEKERQERQKQFIKDDGKTAMELAFERATKEKKG